MVVAKRSIKKECVLTGVGETMTLPTKMWRGKKVKYYIFSRNVKKQLEGKEAGK
jgi:hypothetical protein